MPTELLDLWGDDIKVDVLTPLVILKSQDEPIRRKTHGILRTEVTTLEDTEDDEHGPGQPARLIHALDVIAPVLSYRETLLEVSHDVNRTYPAVLSIPNPIRWDLDQDPPVPTAIYPDLKNAMESCKNVTAYSSDELLKYLRRALQSRYTKSALESLLAQSNEAKMKSDPKS